MPKYQLKMRKENIELHESELAELQYIHEYVNECLGGRNRTEKIKKIEGKHFWVSCARMSSGNAIQRNQPPVEVIAVLDSRDGLGFRMISKTGKPMSKKVNLYDNAGNRLHICETKRQAQYMYNKDLENMIKVMDRRITEMESVKDKILTMEQEVNNY